MIGGLAVAARCAELGGAPVLIYIAIISPP